MEEKQEKNLEERKNGKIPILFLKNQKKKLKKLKKKIKPFQNNKS